MFYYYLKFVDHIISNIGNILTCIIKYYTHLTYFDEKPTKKEKKTSHNTTKADRVYKSPKSIRNKVN